MGFFNVVLVDQAATCDTCKKDFFNSDENSIWSWAREHASRYPAHEIAVHVNKRWEWTGT